MVLAVPASIWWYGGIALVCSLIYAPFFWFRRTGKWKPIDWRGGVGNGMSLVPLALAIFHWYAVLAYFIWGSH